MDIFQDKDGRYLIRCGDGNLREMLMYGKIETNVKEEELTKVGELHRQTA